MDLDLALRIKQPASLTDASSPDDKRNFEKWDRSNRMSLMIIKHSILEAFRGAVSDKITKAKEFLTEIEKRFVKNNKAKTSTLLQSLISIKYNGKGNIREYIMGMSFIASKLKALKLELSDDLLVHLVLISLPALHSQFKVSYNCQKEKWTLNKLISYCVQEEERLKQDKTESAHLASTSKDKGKKRKNNEAAKGPAQKKQQQNKEGCFFCNKPGHVKNDCTKYHAWRAKKGLPELPKPSDAERHIFVGDGKSIEVSIPVNDQEANPDPQQENVNQTPIQDEIIVPEEQTQQPQEPVPLRRSTRERRNAIPDDFFVFLQEHEEETGMVENDPINFHQAMQEGVKPIGCKWIFKTKRDSNGNVERSKARLVAKDFTQKEGIDFKETFSPVSSKDPFRTIMALVAHFDLELRQMDVKTAFLNGDIDKAIYMVQPENFELGDPKNMVCKLTKSIYRFKQAYRQWYHKFHQVIISFGFETNVVDNCVYHKFSGSKHIFLVLYVDDILLATNDIGMLHETKRFLSKKFEMKDLGDASFVLGILIQRDRSRGILGLSQRSYIDKVLKRFGMQDSKQGNTPISKGDKFSLNQCPRTNLEVKEMQKIPYASAVGSLMYAMVCMRPDIAYIVGMLGRYLSNPEMDHWKAAKRVMRYL
ncbi:hypothetical protein AAC387_Pa11g1379 [Persea americana]